MNPWEMTLKWGDQVGGRNLLENVGNKGKRPAKKGHSLGRGTEEWEAVRGEERKNAVTINNSWGEGGGTLAGTVGSTGNGQKGNVKTEKTGGSNEWFVGGTRRKTKNTGGEKRDANLRPWKTSVLTPLPRRWTGGGRGVCR